MARQEARNQVALGTQDGHFIPGSLAENLSYPSVEVDEVKCRKILETLQLDYGPDHPVAEYGRNLSIGEQRRIIFGRALYSDKPILILDEIDANVDEDTRARIYQIIRREVREKIIIMISHLNPTELDGSGCLAVTIERARSEV
jgi:ATP-binding cassette subfamily C protein CydC